MNKLNLHNVLISKIKAMEFGNRFSYDFRYAFENWAVSNILLLKTCSEKIN